MTNESLKNTRLKSLDTLRGFDLLWIIGCEYFIRSLAHATHWKWLEFIAIQLNHVKWAGFHAYDLVFPLFMFISGVAIHYAITGKQERGVPNSTLYRKIIRRAVFLIFLGLLYNGAFGNGFSDLRYASVLAQIGLAYFFTALIVLHTRRIGIGILWLAGILCFIAFMQLEVPVPGVGAGVMTPSGSINTWIDQHLLPGKFYGGILDQEGLLCNVSAICVTLMGSLAGFILPEGNPATLKKGLKLLFPGMALLIIALLISTFYPIIKSMWTVPFDLLTAGISSLLLALFYFVIDVKKKEKWTFFFRVIGMNSITIYIGSRIIDFREISSFFLGWLAKPAGAYRESLLMAGVVALEWGLLYFLYKKKIFLNV